MTQGYTFETVKTSTPPPSDRNTAQVAIDLSKTFMDVPENSGDASELPVIGTSAVIPNQRAIAEVGAALNTLTVATYDTHLRGNNPTIAGFSIMVDPYTFVTPAMVDEWIAAGETRLQPTVKFAIETYRDWLASLAVGGAVAWPRHGDPTSPLYHIEPSIYRALVKNPNLQILRKGQQESRYFPGLCPESYSAEKMSTGEKLGLSSLLDDRGVEVVYVYGNCGDFCGGETAYDLSEAGFVVWMITDAQGSVKLPNYGGESTSEVSMVKRLLAKGVNFCTTSAFLSANGFKLN